MKPNSDNTVQYVQNKFFNNTLTCSDPVSCSKSPFQCKNAWFSSNGVYFHCSLQNKTFNIRTLIHTKTVEFVQKEHFQQHICMFWIRFLFQITILIQKRVFFFNPVYFRLFEGKQNISDEKPYSSKMVEFAKTTVFNNTYLPRTSIFNNI